MPVDDIRIVLIDPQHPGNIGAVARAMKTMNLSRLYLVRPSEFPSYEAERRAAGSADVLEQAIVLEDAAEAVHDCQLVIGGSARTRSHPLPVLDARESAKMLVEESSSGASVAAIFGPERTGLANEDLDRCNFWMRIPTSAEFSSLNLASAVQLLCYEVLVASREGLRGSQASDSGQYPSQSEMEFFYQHLERTLDMRKFTGDNLRAVTFAKFRRLFGRARPAIGELKLLHSLLRLMESGSSETGASELATMPAGDDAALWDAYRETDYAAVTLPGVVIRLGSLCAPLDALLDERGFDCWVFITAWNPESKQSNEQDNKQRNRDLRRELSRKNLAVFAGKGWPRKGGWTPEESFLAFGVDRYEALRLGFRWRQNAVVWGRRGQRPELLDCRKPSQD